MSEFDFETPIPPEGPVIPDSIEPYRGYKALDIVAATAELCSPSYATVWPVWDKLSAVCPSGASRWTWVPVEREPRELDATDFVNPGFSVVVTASSAAVGVVPTAYPPEPKPNNPLPPGWNWSWEPLTHDAPAEGCNCGIYVASDPEGCLSYLSPTGVIVEIALWGKVIPAHSGARGQYGYPQRILAPEQILKEVRPTAELYQIPIEVLDVPEPKEEEEPALVIKTNPAVAQAMAQVKLPGDLVRWLWP